MNHQDWKPVILKNPKAAPKVPVIKEVVKKPQGQFVKEADAETNPIKMVNADLKRSIIMARNNYTAPGSDKVGMSQKEFAALIKVKEADLKLLEQGKMDLKQAKQIGLAIEKHLKVKVLSK